MTTMTDARLKIDETSCGPLCQHPQCWYSNRRLDRGLPRTQDIITNASSSGYASQDDGDDEGSLPTLKVLNLLEDYGYDPQDRYPTRYPPPKIGVSHPTDNTEDAVGLRSSSAPLVLNATQKFKPQPKEGPSNTPQMPKTPHQTPVHSRSEPRQSSHRRHLNKSAPARSAPYMMQRSRISKVDLQDVFETTRPKHQGVAYDPKIYIWCPSKQSQEQASKEPVQITNAKASVIQPKDVTAEMIPVSMETSKQAGKKSKKKDTHQAPTGGRPYTHPAREPPPLTRRTLPQDIDEGIAQLLQLPRDVLLEVLEHTKESDLFDKSKVSALLEKLMPLIRFDKENLSAIHHHEPLSPPNSRILSHQPSPIAPLHSCGILQQKKVTLLDGRPKKIDPLRAPPPTRMPLFLDEAACSGITTSTYTGRDRQDIDDIGEGDEERETMMLSPTVVSEELQKRKPLGPIRATATEMSHYSRRKVTSVSARTLPPLEPGVRAIRPFNYAGQPVDFALSPLSTPDQQASEKPSSPYSGRASTVYVTVPSQLSDHSPPLSPTNYDRNPVPPITRQSSAHYSSISTAPSDDFNTIHGVSPLDSSHILKAPYGTPAVVKQGTYSRENTGITRTTTSSGKADTERLQNNVGAGVAMETPSVDPTLQTIHEGVVDSRQQRDINTASTDTSILATPMKPPESTASPYDASTSVMAQASDKAMGSPVPLMSPHPPTATPEVWPMIDERDYMKSPERKIERLSSKKMEMILAPVAPPPSPEPSMVDVDYDIQEVANKSTAASLTPLAEEEEEEGDIVRRDMESAAGEEPDRTGTRSRGYLGDDEDFGEGDSRINTAETNVVNGRVLERIPDVEEERTEDVNDERENQEQDNNDENAEEQIQALKKSAEAKHESTNIAEQVVSQNNKLADLKEVIGQAAEQVDGPEVVSQGAEQINKDENDLKQTNDAETNEDQKEEEEDVNDVENNDDAEEKRNNNKAEEESTDGEAGSVPKENKED